MAEETFTCPRCGRTSYNPNDRREGYCGNCHDWTGVPGSGGLDPAELKRLTSPPPPVPSFGRYLWQKNHWVYFNVPMSFLGLMGSIFLIDEWWGAVASLFFGVLFGASGVNALGSWSLWKSRKRLREEDAAWVEKISTGDRAFPRPIAQAMQNFVAEGKVGAAAHLALEYLKQTDPEARRWMEEFDQLPEDEKERRRREAMSAMEFDPEGGRFGDPGDNGAS